jgi:rare lipoprotein A
VITGVRRGVFALILPALLLIACSGQPEIPWGGSSDGAPLRSISPDEVANAVPRPDPILAAGNKSPYTVLGKSYNILDDASGYREQGIASWYGTKFNGRKTSNGEIFDLYQATAAHKTLPIPSYAKVTNVNNGRSVIVRINDRGPFHSERLIDLSYGAAVKLGYMEQGTAPVEVELLAIAGVDDRRNIPLGSYRYLQLGAYADSVAAQNLRDTLAGMLGVPVSVSPVQSGEALLYRVRVGPVADPGQLSKLQKQLKNAGYSSVQALP